MSIEKHGFTEVKFTQDLSAYKEFLPSASNEVLMGAVDKCQESLHQWGEANRVSFAGKKGILSRA